jgi:hypothetical protein
MGPCHGEHPEREVATDHGKLDAGLAAALHDVAGTDGALLEIFVTLSAPASPEQIALLESHGVRGAGSGGRTLSATVSTPDAAWLSDQAWIRRLSLSRIVRPVTPPD